MGLLQLISRQVGAADIAWGDASFSYIDENGISHTMQQVNATMIPYAVTQDSSGNVVISGTLSAASVAATTLSATSATIPTLSGNVTITGVLTTANADPSILIGSNYALGEYNDVTFGNVAAATVVGGYSYAITISGTIHLVVKSTGIINIPNMPAYTNNEAALAAGLVAGDLYRMKHDPVNNADPASVCVVY